MRVCGRNLGVAVVLVCLVAQVWAQAGAPPRTPLQRELDRVLGDPALRGASISCRAIDCATGQVLYSYHAAEPLVPASNMKLATTAAALETLGADYRYETRLGTVGGDLVVIGAGDPNISGRFHGGNITAVFEGWARQLAARGITTIEGDLVADDTLFDRQFIHPTWPRDQLSHWYCAPVGALSLNDNCLDVTVKPGPAVGRSALVTAAPEGPYATLINRATTVAAGNPLIVSLVRRPGTAVVTVQGSVPAGSAGYTGHVTIDHPSLFFATTLRAVLARHGVVVKGACRLADQPTDINRFALLATHTSTLAQTVEVTNTRSQNFYAESLLKLVGARSSRGQGTFDDGARAVERFLAGAGAGPADYAVADGSGLSRRNRLSAMHLTNLLRHMSGRPTGAIYRRSLATAGTTGGLSRRLAEAPYRGRVDAKTGTLSGVSALSGYVTTLDGRTVAFAILINDYRGPAAKARAIQDDVCRALVRGDA